MPTRDIAKRREQGRRSYQRHREKRLFYQRTHYQHIKEQRQKFNQERKRRILTHYGKGRCACVLCAETRLGCLSIDHINGGGTQHRLKLGKGAGIDFYCWLEKQNYPEGYQTLCMNCQFLKRYANNELNKSPANLEGESPRVGGI